MKFSNKIIISDNYKKIRNKKFLLKLEEQIKDCFKATIEGETLEETAKWVEFKVNYHLNRLMLTGAISNFKYTRKKLKINIDIQVEKEKINIELNLKEIK